MKFHDMYRGPFWSIIEFQSRWIAAIFTGVSSIASLAQQRIRVQQSRPQFPHKSAKEIFGIAFSDIVLVSDNQSNRIDSIIMDAETNQGRSIAGGVFRALTQTKWTFERTLTGKPSDGTVHGQAQFYPTNPGELLYQEKGKLILPSQTPLDITQKYLYIYNSSEDLLTVYFVDEQNQQTRLFHPINFQPKEISSHGWIAHGEHLCGQDHYSSSYLFIFNGMNLSRFEITYNVKGPAKDYTSKTIFQPEKLD